MNNSIININAYTTLYSLLEKHKEKPYGIRVWGEIMSPVPYIGVQTFWYATHEERNAVADTLNALAQVACTSVASESV